MKTQRKLSHSKCLILNVSACLLLPHVSESSLYICLITRLGPALRSYIETWSTTQAHLSVSPAADLHTAEQSSGTCWNSLEAAGICANPWYFQEATTAPGSSRYQGAFRLTLIMTFALRWQQETSLCLPIPLRELLHSVSHCQLGLFYCKLRETEPYKFALHQR